MLYVLNGPNINLLGSREPAIYGTTTYAQLEAMCRAKAAALGLAIEFRQTNHEGQLIDWVHEARERAQGIVINPGGLTHTSVSLLDALRASALPVIEVHLSNVHQREEFRRHSYVSLAARAVLCGFGAHGYELALDGLAKIVAG